MTEDINLRFSHLKEKMVDPKFQHNEGLSNEVGYWIFDYPADQELEVRKQIAKISDSPLASRVNLRVFDIYDVMMKLLREQEEYTGRTRHGSRSGQRRHGRRHGTQLARGQGR